MRRTKFRLHILMGERKIRSISAIANETGLTRKTLTKIYNNETNRVEFETLEKLSDFFNCGINDLIYFEDAKQEDPEEEKELLCV